MTGLNKSTFILLIPIMLYDAIKGNTTGSMPFSQDILKSTKCLSTQDTYALANAHPLQRMVVYL